MEVQSAELAERLAAARDVKGVEAAHTAFLDACCQQCFLGSPPLARALQALYALCTRTCALLAQAGILPMRAPGFGTHRSLSQFCTYLLSPALASCTRKWLMLGLLRPENTLLGVPGLCGICTGVSFLPAG